MIAQTVSRRLSARSALATRTSASALCCALALTAAVPAWAQAVQTSPAQTQVASTDAAAPASVASDAGANDAANSIVVSGIRASLDSSAKIKRLSTTIVDSVSAEDIGKLPDVSIADSLARLPGVTAQRLEGRDQRLSIRGLGPDFSTTLLNGREQVTVGDNRGVEYDQYPSEFFKNVNVYKSSDASLIAAGVSGTVDLRMLRPLASDKRVISVRAEGEMNGEKSLNPDSPRYGYRASGTYVDQFADDTFGVAIGVSASQIPSQDQRYNAWGYSGSGTAADPLVLGGAKPYVQSNNLKRYGAVATFEWKPSDRFHSTFDALYSHFTENQILRGIEFPLGFGSDTSHVNNTVADNFATSTTFTGVHAVQRNDTNRRKANNYSLGWNNVVALNSDDTMHFTVDASWSHAKRTDFLLETYTGTGYNKTGIPDTVTVTQQPNGIFQIVPTLNYSDKNLFQITDPQGWGYNGTTAVVQSGFLNKPSFKDDLKALRASLDGEFEHSVIKGWEAGVNYSERKKTSAFTSFFLCPKGGGTGCTVASGTPTSEPVPAGAVLDHQISLGYLGVPSILTLDPLYLYNNALNAVYDNRPVSLVRDNVVKEKVFTGYGKLNIDGIVGGKPLRGSIGLQVVHTKQSSDGSISNFVSNNGVGQVTVLPASASVSYTDFLPSANLSLEIEPSMFIKLGASQTMVRPRLDQERVNQEFSVNPANVGAGTDPQFSPFSSKGGNTTLRPYQSTNIDISLEKYFSRGGYVALAGYFKHLTDFVDSSSNVAYDFSAALGQLTPAQRQIVQQQGGVIGLVSAPTNSGRGYLVGMEATLSLPFSDVSHVLDGFGFYGSASYTDSAIKLGSNPTQAITVPGLS
ncbi:MAG TPA: TonB-dependent receptor, partial [Sphingomonas sp.]|nr:TonB-dependent receptor [Sphingomonas sp.]